MAVSPRSAGRELRGRRTLRDAKRVLRAAIDVCLDGRPLNLARSSACAIESRCVGSLSPGRVRDGAQASGGIALGVNIDHVATLRQALGPLSGSHVCRTPGEEAGATASPCLREDRDIQDRDVTAMREALQTA